MPLGSPPQGLPVLMVDHPQLSPSPENAFGLQQLQPPRPGPSLGGLLQSLARQRVENPVPLPLFMPTLQGRPAQTSQGSVKASAVAGPRPTFPHIPVHPKHSQGASCTVVLSEVCFLRTGSVTIPMPISERGGYLGLPDLGLPVTCEPTNINQQPITF